MIAKADILHQNQEPTVRPLMPFGRSPERKEHWRADSRVNGFSCYNGESDGEKRTLCPLFSSVAEKKKARKKRKNKEERKKKSVLLFF